MRGDPIIEVRDLVKRYGELTAVDSVSFEVKEGEIFGLLGPNGAGKTTTIAILSSLIPPTSGTALVAGIDVTRDSLAARSKIGVVPQEIALYPSLSARENLRFWGRMYGVPSEAMRQGLTSHIRMPVEMNMSQKSTRLRESRLTTALGQPRRLRTSLAW